MASLCSEADGKNTKTNEKSARKKSLAPMMLKWPKPGNSILVEWFVPELFILAGKKSVEATTVILAKWPRGGQDHL